MSIPDAYLYKLRKNDIVELIYVIQQKINDENKNMKDILLNFKRIEDVQKCCEIGCSNINVRLENYRRKFPTNGISCVLCNNYFCKIHKENMIVMKHKVCRIYDIGPVCSENCPKKTDFDNMEEFDKTPYTF